MARRIDEFEALESACVCRGRIAVAAAPRASANLKLLATELHSVDHRKSGLELAPNMRLRKQAIVFRNAGAGDRSIFGHQRGASGTSSDAAPFGCP